MQPTNFSMQYSNNVQTCQFIGIMYAKIHMKSGQTQDLFSITCPQEVLNTKKCEAVRKFLKLPVIVETEHH